MGSRASCGKGEALTDQRDVTGLSEKWEQLQVAFVIACDEAGLTVEQGLEEARQFGYRLELAAEDRAAYV